MKFVTIRGRSEGRPGVMLGEDILDLGRASVLDPAAHCIPATLAGLIASGGEGLSLATRIAARVMEGRPGEQERLREIGALTPAASTRLGAPLPRPGILLSHGRAYRSHIAEMKKDDKPPEHPIGFMKNVHSIIGPGDAIVLPRSAPDMVDFEAEISVVFSKPCHGIAARDAMDHVFGFTILNDVSARNWVGEMAKNPDLNRMGKQFATFAPMGPCIATLDEIADPADIRLVTKLNGAVMQDARTRDLIWSIPELIEYYARWYPFQAGDVMTSGTPAGVGFGRTPKVFMQAGDRISITVDGVGELANTITADDRYCR